MALLNNTIIAGFAQHSEKMSESYGFAATWEIMRIVGKVCVDVEEGRLKNQQNSESF